MSRYYAVKSPENDEQLLVDCAPVIKNIREKFNEILGSKTIKRSQLKGFAEWLDTMQKEESIKETSSNREDKKEEKKRNDIIKILSINVEKDEEDFYKGEITVELSRDLFGDRKIEKKLEKEIREMFGDADLSVNWSSKECQKKDKAIFELAGDLQLVYDQKGLNNLVV